jgi:hypothetical protein
MQNELLSAHVACRVLLVVDLGFISLLPTLFDQLDSKNGVYRG